MLKLYNFDRSPYGVKVRIALAEKNVPYEGIVPQNKNEDPEFAKLNPLRLTPVLVLEDNRVLYESTIINEYLEEAWPKPAMLPRDPYERARLRLIEDVSDQHLYPAIRSLTLAQYEFRPPVLIRKPADQVDHKAIEENTHKVHQHLARLEAELAGRTWFGGDLFSLADAALAAAMTLSLPLLGILPDAKYPAIGAWVKRIAGRPSYRAGAPKEPARIQER
jgi:glutathione S-transferase